MKLAPLLATELTDKQFYRISDLVKQVAGINLHDGKKELVKARLNKRLRKLGMTDFREYLDYLENDSTNTELVAMLDAISTNLTSFFREISHFECLRDNILSRLIADAPRRGQKLRIWSAGCSSGEEPYSLAMWVLEHLPNASKWDVAILATDLSTKVLDRASQGVYAADRVEGMAPQFRNRYFTSIPQRPDRAYQISPNVRQLITFARLNLMEQWPMRGPFDIIFCRNVMIYFDKPTQGKLVNRYWDMLGPDGTLFIGHSESLTGIQHRFKYVQPTVYRKS